MRGIHPTLNKLTTTTEDSDDKGKLLIWDLCKKGIDSIHNMWAVNTDVSSYFQRSLRKFLQRADN